MRTLCLAAAILAAFASLAAAQDKDEDLAETFSRMQGQTAAAEASLAARRAEIERLKAQLPSPGGIFSSHPKCELIHHRPGSNAERARQLMDEMAARIIKANNLSIPGFCGVTISPADDLDASSFLLHHGDFPVSADDAAQAKAEAAVPKAIRVALGTFQRVPDDATLAALLGHELAHLALGHPVAGQMDGEALNGVAERFNSSDFDQPLFRHLERRKLGYVQAQEVEADRVGRLYIARAGYDPEGMARMISLLDDPASKKGLADHPAPEDRLRLLRGAPLDAQPSAKAVLHLEDIRRLLK